MRAAGKGNMDGARLLLDHERDAEQGWQDGPHAGRAWGRTEAAKLLP